MTSSMSSGQLDDAAIAQARAEQARAAAVSLVQGIYRLVKALFLHAETNETVANLLRFSQETISDYCQKSGVQQVSLHFTGDTVFINGQMLRASKQSFQCAVELGTLLDKGGVNELTIPMATSFDDLSAFARAVAAASRGQSGGASLLDAPCGVIKVRRAKGESVSADAARQESVEERIIRTYASAIVVMRELDQQLRSGDIRLPHRIKRVAQRLISHADENARTLTSLVGGRVGGADDATRLVNTAIVAIAMARQLTRERPILTALATSALLYDVGRLRLECARASASPSSSIRSILNEDERDRLPASSAAMLALLGRIHPPSMTRTTIVYEALALDRADRLGPPYRGKRPETVLARILHLARRFVELITPPPNEPAVTLDAALRLLETSASDATSRVDLRLLLGALGFFPTGTLVELNTGEMAVVLAVPQLPVHFARPPVRILYDARMRMVDPPIDIDLAEAARPGEPIRCVRGLVHADEQQMRHMRAYVEAASNARSAPPLRPARDEAPASARSHARPEPLPADPPAPPPPEPPPFESRLSHPASVDKTVRDVPAIPDLLQPEPSAPRSLPAQSLPRPGPSPNPVAEPEPMIVDEMPFADSLQPTDGIPFADSFTPDDGIPFADQFAPPSDLPPTPELAVGDDPRTAAAPRSSVRNPQGIAPSPVDKARSADGGGQRTPEAAADPLAAMLAAYLDDDVELPPAKKR